MEGKHNDRRIEETRQLSRVRARDLLFGSCPLEMRCHAKYHKRLSGALPAPRPELVCCPFARLATNICTPASRLTSSSSDTLINCPVNDVFPLTKAIMCMQAISFAKKARALINWLISSEGESNEQTGGSTVLDSSQVDVEPRRALCGHCLFKGDKRSRKESANSSNSGVNRFAVSRVEARREDDEGKPREVESGGGLV